MENLIHEECGIFGIYDPSGTNDVASSTYYGLFALQHRGQESCGIAVNDRGVITYHKDVGLVRDVFSKECLEKLGKGQIAVGHTRYSTFGTVNQTNAQPLVVRHVKGQMAVVHNGNLTNAQNSEKSLNYRVQFSIQQMTLKSLRMKSFRKDLKHLLLKKPLKTFLMY